MKTQVIKTECSFVLVRSKEDCCDCCYFFSESQHCKLDQENRKCDDNHIYRLLYPGT